MTLVLGIETSCDETAVAIFDGEQKKLLGHCLHSQIEDHAPFGGVVPEMASRNHLVMLPKLTQQLLDKTQIKPQDLSAIAYTKGPGLAGALLTGAMFGRTLAYVWNKPAFGIHHLEGHLMALLLEPDAPPPPFVALLASGGHTQWLWVKAWGQYELLGQTLDDAAGEAFDKVGQMMGLGYPGGPKVAKLATQGIAGHFKLTRPMIDRPGIDVSFSGLKTQVRNIIESQDLTEQDKANLALSFEQTVIDTLRIKTQRALKQTGLNTLILAGGVAANQSLRAKLSELPIQVFYPKPEFCTDNGAMIACAGWMAFQQNRPSEDLSVEVFARCELPFFESDDTGA